MLKLREKIYKEKLTDGLVKQNIILMSGLVITPVIISATTLKHSFVIAVYFSIMSFLSILICSFISRKIVYTVRIIIYALVASVVYMPVIIFINTLFPKDAVSIGIYLPLTTVNSLLLSKTESRFYLREKVTMVVDVIGYILGFDIFIMFIGIIRELLSFNTIWGVDIQLSFSVPGAESTFGGYLLLGLLAAFVRYMYSKVRGERT